MTVDRIKRDRSENDVQTADMFRGPVIGVLVKLALPVFSGMIFQVLYTVTDMIWISRIDMDDPSFIGGVGIIYPLFMLVVAFGSGILVGTSSLVARSIGSGDRFVLTRVAESGLAVAVLIAAPLVILCYLYDDEILLALGARGDYFIHAREYLHYMIPAGSLMLLGNVFNGILMGEGLMKKIMTAVIIATLCNICLDPFFIFLLGMGVRGAGMATVVSQLIASMYILSRFTKGRTAVKIRWKPVHISPIVMKKILAVGFPQIAGQISLSVGYLVFNRMISQIDPLALSAFSICTRFDQILLMPILSIGTALITMIGQNYGRNNFSRVLVIWRTAMMLAVGIVAFLAAVIVLAAPVAYPFFSDVDAVVRYAVAQTRVVEFSFIAAAVAVLSRSSFQALGRAVPGLVINVMRSIGIAVPVSLLLVFAFGAGIPGVWLGIAAGNGMTAIVSLVWMRRTLSKRLP